EGDLVSSVKMHVDAGRLSQFYFVGGVDPGESLALDAFRSEYIVLCESRLVKISVVKFSVVKNGQVAPVNVPSCKEIPVELDRRVLSLW
ncbi:MAG TPA: hypothetical protein VLB90_11135, partial [Pseudomonadales bacterium]|nr:hypothetical protein [Pseudomonadales bacterium]